LTFALTKQSLTGLKESAENKLYLPEDEPSIVATYDKGTGIGDTHSLTDNTISDVVEIIRLVNATTVDGDWMLRDPIVRQTHHQTRNQKLLRSEPYHKPMVEILQDTLDIASSQLSTFRKCTRCLRIKRQLMWECSWGEFKSCSSKECKALRKTRSICSTCYEFGTID